MTPNYNDTLNLKTSKLIQLNAITGKRVAYRGCNLKKKGVQWIILLDTNTERIFVAGA